MKKISYIILSLALCTAGIGTAAHHSSNSVLPSIPAAISDTIETDDEFGEFLEDEESEEEDDDFFGEDDEFGTLHEEISETDPSAEDLTVNDSTANDLELTEGMLIDVEQQMDGWNARNYLKEDTTQVATTTETIADEEYIARLKRIPAIMEMPYNEVVRKYIDQYSGRLRRSVSMMLGAQNFYVPMFEEALESENCPLELKYLPIIESALDPTATSRVGAAGLWQFMIATGKQHGLEVNSLVDERRDPIKSSYAAAKYFKELYAQFDDWTLVIAAYNCGPNNVNKAIQRAGGSRDYWQIYPFLPRETRGYVPAFIAANYIMQFYCEHDITPMEATLPAESDTLTISQDLHFQQIAEMCDVDINALRTLNPQYRTDVIPGYWKPCTLRLPQEAVSNFIACGDSIYHYRADELLPRRSTAAVNDTYVPVIKSGNGNTTRSSSRSYKGKSKKKGGSRSVTIRQGDTLGAIARRNGTTVAKLKQLNGISGSNIRAGKKIRVR